MHDSCENLEHFGDNTWVVKYGLKMNFVYDAVRKLCNLLSPYSDKEVKGVDSGCRKSGQLVHKTTFNSHSGNYLNHGFIDILHKKVL